MLEDEDQAQKVDTRSEAQKQRDEKFWAARKARAWKPGQSGNPKGRPKGSGKAKVKTVSEVAQLHAKKAIQAIVEVLQNPKSAPSVRLAAANSLLDRAIGKPKQSMEVDAKAEQVLSIRDLHLQALIDINAKALKQEKTKAIGKGNDVIDVTPSEVKQEEELDR